MSPYQNQLNKGNQKMIIELQTYLPFLYFSTTNADANTF